MLTATEVWDDNVLDILVAAADGLGANLKIGLNTAILTPTKVLTLADMVEPTYAGYARQVVVMGASQRDNVYGIVSEGEANVFAMAAPPVATLVQGYFLANKVVPVLAGYEPLPVPYQMNDEFDALTIVVRYIESNPQQGNAYILT